MTKIKGTVDHGLLQIIIRMIRPPPPPLQMVVSKTDCPSDGQNQRDGGGGIVTNDHLDGHAMQMVICKEDGPQDDQQFQLKRTNG